MSSIPGSLAEPAERAAQRSRLVADIAAERQDDARAAVAPRRGGRWRPGGSPQGVHHVERDLVLGDIVHPQHRGALDERDHVGCERAESRWSPTIRPMKDLRDRPTRIGQPKRRKRARFQMQA